LPAARALSEFSRRQQSKRVVGYLCTTWGAVGIPSLAEWPPLVEAMKEWSMTPLPPRPPLAFRL
jgi:hypothetical protein